MSKQTFTALTLLLALGIIPLEAQTPPTPPPTSPAGAPTPPGLKEFAEIIKEAKETTGFFPIFQHEDKVWIEISESQLGEPFLFTTNLAKGIGEAGIYAGMMGGGQLVAFRRAGNTMRLMALNPTYQPGDDKATKIAIEQSFSESILNTAPVLCKPHPERKSVLVDASALLFKDFPRIGMSLEQMYRQSYSFDRANTTFGKIRVTERQTSFNLDCHFSSPRLNVATPTTPPNMRPSVPDTIPDPQSMFIGLIYNFMKLPDTPMTPRLADDRIGFFVSSQWDFSKDREIDIRNRFINRWRLEKKDPSLAISEPKEPIVYWIDKAVPEKYRSTIAEAILEWNKAFEKAGFKNAIQVKNQPDDADWDTLDARHASIQWLVGTDVAFAIGPSVVDPRTGEILDADIGLGEGMMRYSAFQVREEVLKATGSHMQTGRYGTMSMSELQEVPFALDLLEARGEIDPMSPEGEAFLLEWMRWLVTHEVGHTLGLRHNFKASTAYTDAQINDPEFTKKNGMAASIMEYTPMNLTLEGEKRGQLISNAIGPWDYWVIEYGYKPFSASSEADELARIAGRSDDPLLIYGTDEDNMFGLDPEVNTYDLGSNPLAFAKKRIQLSAELVQKLQKRTFKAGEPYHILRRQTSRAINQVYTPALMATKYIGGISYNRDHAGTNRLNYVPIPADRQREALQLLEKQIFSMDAFTFKPEFLSRFTYDRTDIGDAFGSSINYSPNQHILSLQKAVLSSILAPSVAQRILDASEKQTDSKQVFKLSELYDTLQSAIWAELRGIKEPTSTRRALQREHLRGMINILLRATPFTPDDARSLVREKLRQLQTQLRNTVATRQLSRETKAHFNECIALLDDSFKASLQRTTF
ncbi:MAG: zinc-dependent metalloprotease [Holophagaceae bacterium]|nr:zinc-dependent metalloprotease [Holophagaceae bacterium]